MRANNVGNRTLMTGAAWTLAVALAPAWFKSSLPEPIYLWPLGVVALGWAGLLLYALARERRAARAARSLAGSEALALIDGVARATGARMQGACAELMRVDELLAHAIEQLMAAFNGASEQMRARERELAQQAAGAQDTSTAESLHAAVERVRRDVDSAVTAMQFRDVVGQKLDHVRRELEALGLVMQKIGELSFAQIGPAAPTEPPEVSDPTDLGAHVRGLLRELQQPGNASPARQELMHAGEIELF